MHLGTVGRPYPGQEVRLDPENGEYQYRGRHVFMGCVNVSTYKGAVDASVCAPV